MPQICWTVISPLALITVFVAGCVTWTRPSYGAVQYPEWAHIIGQTQLFVYCTLHYGKLGGLDRHYFEANFKSF